MGARCRGAGGLCRGSGAAGVRPLLPLGAGVTVRASSPGPCSAAGALAEEKQLCRGSGGKSVFQRFFLIFYAFCLCNAQRGWEERS